MDDSIAALPTHHDRLNEFFLARQPILDREQRLTAYELLFRSAATGPANVSDDLAATASVIAHTNELGVDQVIGNARGFVNVDAAVLMSDFIDVLPPEKVVLEILETVKATPEVVRRVRELAERGYTFALDDVIAASEDVRALTPLAKIIKIDVLGMEAPELFRLSCQFKAAGKTMLAEKVESIEQFRHCFDLGFEYFQGYYFAKPAILSGKKLSPSQLAVMQLMALLASDADTRAIERCIKQDASLGLMLLKLVNTPAAGVTQRIDSLSQALLVLGRRQLQRWLQILLYADGGRKDRTASPLLVLATTRGRLLELIAGKLRPNDRHTADIAFTVGIMSLMDSLFGMPMTAILEKIAVLDEVRDALLERRGFYGEMLTLAGCIERLDESEDTLGPLVRKWELTSDDLNTLQLAAFRWSDSVSVAAGTA
ncbi:MAG: EAL and HDOD domain-containing protein [Burkholderiaceae bacterium]